MFFTQLKKQVVMKKVLRHCSQGSTWASNRHQGMTLIELLVVITIIGIVAAIAFPVLFGQINKAKEVEAVQTVKHLSARQQEFYLENNQFTDSLNELGISFPKKSGSSLCLLRALGFSSQQTPNYCYGIKVVVASESTVVLHIAMSNQSKLATHVNVVYLKNTEIISCHPIRILGCSSASFAKCIKFLSTAMKNPTGICSGSN
jgi:prepilin-type N-terminal cleavage/methylation domain-containing protein